MSGTLGFLQESNVQATVPSVVRRKIPSTHPRLKRHVNHDPRSRLYAFTAPPNAKITSVAHARHIPILDQGQVGSCTGNAAIGALACDPIFGVAPLSATYTLNESGAQHLYSAAEVIDGEGPFPPHDVGSSGLSVAKALKNAGLITSYRHAFSMRDALVAAASGPFIAGINWYSEMFYPDVDGRVHPRGTLAGGHEVLCRQVDAERRRVWFDNSWGTSWGVAGRFYLSFDDFETLLAQRGDVTILTPALTPPVVTTDSVDVLLNAAFSVFMLENPKPIMTTKLSALCSAVAAWRTAKHL